MRKIVLGLLVGCTALVSSCSDFLKNDLEETVKKNEQEMLTYINSKNLNMKKADNGMYYQITKTNASGDSIKVGDEVVLHYVMSLLDGTKIDSSLRSTNKPATVIFGGTIGLQGISDAISKLKSGERGTFLIPSYLAYGSQNYEKIPGKSVLVVDLEIVKNRSEDKQIEDYIATGMGNVTVVSREKTESGLRVLKLSQTTGTQLASGQTAGVVYNGYLASSIKEFDKGQIDVYLGSNSVVKGFEEGLLKLKVGEKAVLVFPSALGYGTQGVADNTNGGYKIPPYSPLIFVVEIKSTR